MSADVCVLTTWSVCVPPLMLSVVPSETGGCIKKGGSVTQTLSGS